MDEKSATKKNIAGSRPAKIKLCLKLHATMCVTIIYIGSTLILQRDYIVPVLGREEGYTTKYGLIPRKFLRAQPEGTSEGSGHVS